MLNKESEINYISLGAGVQSSTMALLAKEGLIKPMPSFAIFADTQVEPKSVYRWLKYLEEILPFPIIKVSKYNLYEASTKKILSKNGNYYAKLAIPAYIIDDEGKKGIMMRQCTSGAKIEPINSFVREKIGRNAIAIEWMGISYDEISRIKESRESWKVKRYPLIELRMTRYDCIKWLQNNGYPEAPRSACIFCPFRSDKEWLRLKNEEPEEFQRAVEYEKKYQETYKDVLRGIPHLHKSFKNLEDVDFEKKNDNQLNMFNNECEGYCGV